MRIHLIESLALIRDGLLRCLADAFPSASVSACANQPGVLKGLSADLPDLLVLGLDSGRLDQIECAQRLKREDDSLRLVFVSMQSDASTVRRALDAGADGYVLRSDDIGDLVDAVHAAINDRVYLSPQLRGLVEIQSAGNQRPGPIGFEALTERQVEVLSLFASGLSTREIASRLKLKTKTLDRHRRQIQWALGVDSIAELTRVAVHHGLVRLDGSIVPPGAGAYAADGPAGSHGLDGRDGDGQTDQDGDSGQAQA